MAALPLLFAAPAGAMPAPPPVTAAQAIENYETMVAGAQPGGECIVPDDPDAITVCGRRESSQRVGPTNEPGMHLREAPGGADALALSQCHHRCQEAPRGSLLSAAIWGIRAIGRVLDPDN